MYSIDRRMNFEAEQRAKEQNAELHELIAQKLKELGDPWSVEKMCTAVNWALREQDPNAGELRYELDPGADH